MRIEDLFATSITALTSNKVRSFLTTLGVVIGVSAVILLISLGKGIENYIAGEFENLGSNLIFVTPGKLDFANDPAASFGRNKFSQKHLERIRRENPDIILVAEPYVIATGTIKYKNRTYFANIQGDDYTQPQVVNTKIESGRFFTKSEVKAKKRLIVLGYSVKESLFGEKNPVGERVKLDGKSYEVIGTLEKKGRNFDEVVRLPYTTMMNNLDIRNFSGMSVKIKEGIDIDRAVLQIERTLSKDLSKDDFTVLSQEDLLSSIQNIFQVLTLVLSAIAGISLVVGGIGIMNIMLVSVTERTKEIGLRKALGASRKDITYQFLIESVFLSVGGGFLGIILGWGGSLAAKKFINTEIPLGAVILAFAVSAVVGIMFGTYPAIKASKKDPIEALRYE